MDTESIDILGYVAATLTTIAFLPQVIKTWRSRSAKDVSLVMMITFSIGVFLWLLYGLAIQAMPVILANATTLILALLIVILKIRYR
ncbi:SemiSWEET transporter [Microcoleus sp. FACHB-SPT15]|uniref:SemiSWEET transporter n=1 Tax=Microcoleus sp. FACHB-SPT15 TaxID=2692830 RepID=UPI0017854749|nr:SemiSWEET transporter [Microcoleus sp. FACHB-SPT15]MBD1806241.1 SemiSWEET transporter [Microcoleus sp. FACHB-SPT15]